MAGWDKPTVGAAQGRESRLRLSHSERIDRLRLIRSRNVGPKTFQDLIDHFGSAGEALEALPALSSQGGARSKYTPVSQTKIESELAEAERVGATLIGCGEPGYPRWLENVDAPPPLLYVKGRLELADRPTVAIVGARNGSAIGRKFTRMLANDLGTEDLVIASGLARGIDTAAHKAALKTGTIAALAGGLGSVYPPENEKLQSEIGEVGLLVSERPLLLYPKAKDFPRRNRLISGMSAATVVIEAARRSGSLITARLAGEQGREVFAVPGHPLDPRAAGTNRLLQEGAGLVTCAGDIITSLEPILGRREHAGDQSGPSLPAPGTDIERGQDIAASTRERVTAALGPAPIDVDEVIRATELPARDVHVALLELDLAGRLERHGQQLISLKDMD